MNELFLTTNRYQRHYPFTFARRMTSPGQERSIEAEAKKATNADYRRANSRTSLRSPPSGTSEVKVFAAADAYCFCPFQS